MTIKSRINIFQTIIAIAVLTLAGVTYATIHRTDYQLGRVQASNHQLESITALKVNSNRFSEQIAEYLLIGEPERVDFESARKELEQGFARLDETTKQEADFIDSSGGSLDDRRDEQFRIDRMKLLFKEIIKSFDEILHLRGQGKIDEAILMFRQEIENRFDAEFEALLQGAAIDEREEVHRTEREAMALWKRLTWITALTSLAAFLICGIAGMQLLHRLVRPIKLLTEGTEAIARGELDHRIHFQSSDELGTLAQRFNAMAAEREKQRGQLQAAHARLEKDVAERTRQLAAANNRLTELDGLRVRFLADISHEIRTPLTALRGEAEIALRHGSKPESVYRDALGRIVAHSSDMGHLVDDIMFLARSETDTLRFEFRPIVLQDVIHEAMRETEVLGRAARVAVDAQIPNEPIWIDADEQRMKQAFLILLDNAIKYSPAGRPVNLRVIAGEGDAEIVIRNEGAGIPPEEIPYVFERFYRAGNASGSKQSGSGLGLSIAKWLVDKHGGDIAIASEPGKFAEVTMRLPQAEVSALVKNFAG